MFLQNDMNKLSSTTVYVVHLAVIIIWWLGEFGFDRQT